MKKSLYATAGSALALALLAYSPPASADVTVTATITKNKDITVTERITITKLVNLQVETEVLYRSAAEADAIVNQTTTENDVTSSLDQLDFDPSHANDFGIHLSASINNSINDNQGIVGVNQDVGNMSNQGNQVALAVATPANTGPDVNARVLTNAQSEAQQINTNNLVFHPEVPGGDQTEFATGPNEVASIDGSINGNVGIVNVNQNAGNMNNQANSEALAVAINLAGVALSEAALGQVNTNPDNPVNHRSAVFEFGVEKSASMTGSLNGNTGVGGVNQAAGNMANQANIFSLAFIDGGGGVGLGQ
ncbi:MAG: hypothetical protein ACOY3L_09765 [Pseudomonadota bacterium]